MSNVRHVVLEKTRFNNETKQTETIKEEYLICDVCGHANPILRHECEVCSNFLDD